jgi:hypothetical protein
VLADSSAGGVGQGVSDLFGPWRDGDGPYGHGLGETMRHRGQNPAMAIVELDEVGAAEHVSGRKVEYQCLDIGTNDLQQIKGQRIPGLDVRVQEPESGIEAKNEACQPALDLGERIHIVQQRIVSTAKFLSSLVASQSPHPSG